MSLKSLYVTVGDLDEAKAIARHLVENRLAACVNILPGMTSVYRWQDTIEEGPEVLLFVKTTADLAEQATQAIKSLHSYDCPCVLSFAIDGGNPDFLDWISAQTA